MSVDSQSSGPHLLGRRKFVTMLGAGFAIAIGRGAKPRPHRKSTTPTTTTSTTSTVAPTTSVSPTTTIATGSATTTTTIAATTTTTPTTTTTTPTTTTTTPTTTTSTPTTTTSPTTTTAPGPAPAPSGGLLTPQAFGAVGDGIADDTSAVQAALNAGGTLTLSGTYRHTAVLVANVAGATINGPGTLRATVPSKSALKVVASNVTIDGVNLTMPTATARLSAPWETRLWLAGSVGTVVRNTHVDGAGSAGVFIQGASNYLLEDCTVSNTKSDAIHNTAGSHDGIIRRCSTTNSGDDGFAVVSYQADGVQCYNISFESPRFYGNTWGRGFSVVGGHDITFTDIYGQDSDSAMLYFSGEGTPYWTYPTTRVTVNGGTSLRANKNSTVDHGAVVLTVYNNLVDSDIKIQDLHIADTRATASRQVALLATAPAAITRVTMSNFKITNGPSKALYADPTAQFNTAGWVFNDTPLEPHNGW